MTTTRLLLLCAGLTSVSAAAPVNNTLLHQFANLPRYFEPVLGARVPAAQYVGRAGETPVFLENGSARLAAAAGRFASLEFDGARPNPAAEPLDRVPGVSYYATERGVTRLAPIPHYARIRYRDLYPGIDVIYYFSGDRLEYDLVLKPNADPSQVRVRYPDSRALNVTPSGSLRVKVESGEMEQLPPRVFQNGREIAAQYKVVNGMAAFDLAGYDRSQPLTIDPVITLGTGFGGSKRQTIHDIAVDASGAIYITGTTQPENFPATYSMISNGLAPITESGSWGFIAKLAPLNGNGPLQLVYSTVLGFHGQDATADHIGFDQFGNAYVSGKFGQNPWTFNTDGPQCASRTGQIFVTKFRLVSVPPGVDYLNLDYNMSPVSCGSLTYTYLNDMAVSAGGAVYLAGSTSDSGFLREKALPDAFPGTNGFVIQVLPTNANDPAQIHARIGFSTLYGGSDTDRITGLALGPAGDIYVTGVTLSPDITLDNAYQNALFNPYTDATFLARLRPPTPASGQTWNPVSIAYATLLTGNRRTRAEAIAVDSAGNAYVTGRLDFQGYADQVTFPTIRGLNIPASEEAHGFLAMFPPPAPGQNLSPRFSTRLDVNHPTHLAVDNRGGVYVAGQALDGDFEQVNALEQQPLVPRYFLARYWQPTPDAGIQTDYATWIPMNLWSLAWGAGYIHLAGTGLNESPLVNAVAAPNKTAYFMKIKDRVDITIASNFAGRQVNISGSGCGVNGWKTTPAVLPATPGAQCVITMNASESTADTRYLFNGWADGAPEASRTIAVGAENATYAAEFTRQFRLNSRVQPANAGSITPSGISWQNEGFNVQHSATAAACYLFSNWSAGTVGGLTLMSAPKEAIAYFTPNAASATSAVTVQVGAQTVVDGYVRVPVTVRNTSSGPFYNVAFVLDNLSAQATLQKASGATQCAAPAGSPYVNLGTLSAGEVQTFTLTFAIAPRASTQISFTSRVLHGLKPR